VDDGPGSTRLLGLCPVCRDRRQRGEPLDCPDCKAALQRSVNAQSTASDRDDQHQAPRLDGGVKRRIRAARSGGQSLPESVRAYFEPRFGEDFSDVRIHRGPQADEAARSLNARAFTLGRDIVFRSGTFRPDTRAGKELLAHELTHVVQQRSATATPQPLRVGTPGDRFESEAERIASRVVRKSEPPNASGVSVTRSTVGPRVQGIITCPYYLWKFSDTIDECEEEMEPYCGDGGSIEDCLGYLQRYEAESFSEWMFSCVEAKESGTVPKMLASCVSGAFGVAMPTS
jgi:hypothetical protein